MSDKKIMLEIATRDQRTIRKEIENNGKIKRKTDVLQMLFLVMNVEIVGLPGVWARGCIHEKSTTT